MSVSKMETSPVSEGLWLVLRIGMIFGLIPLRLDKNIGKLGVKWSFKNAFPILYSIYTLIANLLIFIFAVIIFFRELGSEANLVEQFLDMVYHCHLIITIIICLVQSPRLPRVFEEWDKVEGLFTLYEDNEQRKLFLKVIDKFSMSITK